MLMLMLMRFPSSYEASRNTEGIWKEQALCVRFPSSWNLEKKQASCVCLCVSPARIFRLPEARTERKLEKKQASCVCSCVSPARVFQINLKMCIEMCRICVTRHVRFLVEAWFLPTYSACVCFVCTVTACQKSSPPPRSGPAARSSRQTQKTSTQIMRQKAANALLTRTQSP